MADGRRETVGGDARREAHPTQAGRHRHVDARLGVVAPRLRVHEHALQQAQADEDADQRGAAKADERQRDAGDRQQPDVHPHVDEELEEEHRRHAGGQQLAKSITRVGRHAQAAPEQRAEERQQRHRPDEAQFLAEHGEDEIGVLHAQKVELSLGAVAQTAPPKPAGADADPRLNDVVALAQGIAVRREEGRQAAAHVVLEQPPHQREAEEWHHQRRGEPFQRRPGRKAHAQPDGQEDQC